jgi:hypothetical protein
MAFGMGTPCLLDYNPTRGSNALCRSKRAKMRAAEPDPAVFGRGSLSVATDDGGFNMPSPFPGMDPWLEAPDLFPGFHDRFVTYASEALQTHLPAPYYADIRDRIWVEFSRRQIGPDVTVLRRDPEIEAFPEETEGGVAVAIAVETLTRPVVVTVPHDEFHESFLQIYHGEDERLVASIEVLSPTNKTPGAKGRDLYLRKQQEILDSQTHLIEIDLLRGGEHATAVPLEFALPKTGRFDYHVCVHRFDNLEDFFVYPIRLAQRLPKIAIPLLPGDPDVPLDLQAVFQRAYETGPYHRRLRYLESEPVPPLTPEQQAWATQRLKNAAKGV